MGVTFEPDQSSAGKSTEGTDLGVSICQGGKVGVQELKEMVKGREKELKKEAQWASD